MPEPLLAGVWVAACTPQGDLIKWGRDGDTEHPFSDRELALAHARGLEETSEDDRFYLLHVHQNGQIRTEEI